MIFKFDLEVLKEIFKLDCEIFDYDCNFVQILNIFVIRKYFFGKVYFF